MFLISEMTISGKIGTSGGKMRKSSSFNTGRIDHLRTEDGVGSGIPVWARYLTDNFSVVYGDLTDGSSISRLIYDIEPDEIYNLGAQAHVRVSFDQPELTMNTNAMGTLRLLEAIVSLNRKKQVKFYQASSSEMFGNHTFGTLLNEDSGFMPCSPYAISKCSAYWQVKYYRSQGIFATNGILFNHESPRRGSTYVTRKITRAATRIALGLQDKLVLGNLSASRDWGYAPDYVKAIYMMMQSDEPGDFVVATGKTNTVQEFLNAVFAKLNLDIHKHVQIDKRYFRPQELHCLQGDSSKMQEKFGWQPEVDFDQLVDVMIESDLKMGRESSSFGTY